MMHKVYRAVALLSILAMPLAHAEEEAAQPQIETELNAVKEETSEEAKVEIKEEAKEEAPILSPFELEYWKCVYQNNEMKIKAAAAVAVPTLIALLGTTLFPRTNVPKKNAEGEGRPSTAMPLPQTPIKAESSSTTPKGSPFEQRYPVRNRTPPKY